MHMLLISFLWKRFQIQSNRSIWSIHRYYLLSKNTRKCIYSALERALMNNMLQVIMTISDSKSSSTKFSENFLGTWSFPIEKSEENEISGHILGDSCIFRFISVIRWQVANILRFGENKLDLIHFTFYHMYACDDQTLFWNDWKRFGNNRNAEPYLSLPSSLIIGCKSSALKCNDFNEVTFFKIISISSIASLFR